MEKGTLKRKDKNNKGYDYGIVEANDNKTYFINSYSLKNCTFSDLSEGCRISFDWGSYEGKTIIQNVSLLNEDVTIDISPTLLPEPDVTTETIANETIPTVTVSTETILAETIPTETIPAETDIQTSDPIEGTKKVNSFDSLPDKIYSLLTSNYQDGQEVLLSEIGSLLAANSISYKAFGYYKFSDFCNQFTDFITIRNKQMENGNTLPYLTFKALEGSPLATVSPQNRSGEAKASPLALTKKADGKTLMRGRIRIIGKTKQGQDYGIIIGENWQTYFFDARFLKNCSFSDLSLFLEVEFIEDPGLNGKKAAKNVSVVNFEGFITQYDSSEERGYIDDNVFFNVSKVKNYDCGNINPYKKRYKVKYTRTCKPSSSGDRYMATSVIYVEEVELPSIATQKDDVVRKGKVTLFYDEKEGGIIDSDVVFNIDRITNYQGQILNPFKKHTYVEYSVITEDKRKYALEVTILSQENIVKETALPAEASGKGPVQAPLNIPTDIRDKVILLLSDHFKENDEIDMEDIGRLFRNNNIFFKNYGCLSLKQFCSQFPEIMKIDKITSDNGLETRASITIIKNSEQIVQNQVFKVIDEELSRLVYVFLINRFKAGMQWPIAAVIKVLANGGYKCERYGIPDYVTFLQQFPHFVTVERVKEENKLAYKVWFKRVPEWDDGANDFTLQKSNEFENKTTPGNSKKINSIDFNTDEITIRNAFSDLLFYVSDAERYHSDDSYSYLILKPTARISEQFGFYKEILLIFSNCTDSDDIIFDVVDSIAASINTTSTQRLERMCSILVSRDHNIANLTKNFMKKNEDWLTIVPFTFEEAIYNINTKSIKDVSDFIIARISEFFSERDFFDSNNPVRKELFFFGRHDFINSILTSYASGDNIGIFGLRRSGKTSILYAVQRTLDRLHKKWIWFNGQDFHHKRWNKALFHIVSVISEKYGIELKHKEEDYIEDHTSTLFEKDMNWINDCNNGESILILIDEIEHITFNIGVSEHWKEGKDFIFFWNCIQAYYNKYPKKFSFFIAGTNPIAFETPLVNSNANPVYQSFLKVEYLPMFSVPETNDMVNTLGNYMGLKFDDESCTYITKYFGGHPFLIRKFCSEVNAFLNKMNTKKPITVSSVVYDNVKRSFDKSEFLSTYCGVILNVLETNFREEYETLKSIALVNGQESLGQQPSLSAISHLTGYGIIKNESNCYGFKNDAIREYLVEKYKYNRTVLTLEEKWIEITTRRGYVEIELRKIARVQLKSRYGEDKAKEIRLNYNNNSNDSNENKDKAYTDLFDANKCNFYWSDLNRLICGEWEVFKNLFSDREFFRSYGIIVNKLRSEAHAKEISDENMNGFRTAISWFENEIKNAK